MNCALVFAAGKGERMRPLTLDRPKALLEVGGRTLLDWHLDALEADGYERVVINTSYCAAAIEQHLRRHPRPGLDLHLSYEGIEPLETGGGMRRALALLGEAPFLAINVDLWTDAPRFPRTLPTGVLAHLVLVPNPPHHPQGDFVLDRGRLRLCGPERLTFAGLGWYRPDWVASWPEGRYPLGPLVREAIDFGVVHGQCHTGLWIDVGTPERLAEANRRCR